MVCVRHGTYGFCSATGCGAIESAENIAGRSVQNALPPVATTGIRLEVYAANTPGTTTPRALPAPLQIAARAIGGLVRRARHEEAQLQTPAMRHPCAGQRLLLEAQAPPHSPWCS